MSDSDSEIMLTYFKAVKSYESNFNKIISNGNVNNMTEIIKKIKVLHGCAIYQNQRYLNKILEKNQDDITETEWLNISSNESILYCIQNILRKSESSAFGRSKETHTSDTDDKYGKSIIKNLTVGNSFTGEKYDNNTGYTIKTDTENGTIDTDNRSFNTDNGSFNTDNTDNGSFNTDTESDDIVKMNRTINTSDFNKIKKFDIDDIHNINDMKGGYHGNKSYLSDYIDNLNTSEAERLENGGVANKKSKYEKYKLNNNEDGLTDFIDQLSTEDADQLEREYENQYGGEKSNSIKDVSVVYFWADWCGPSQQFNPVWKKFTEVAESQLPGVKIADLNANDKQLQQYPAKIGVNSFPTVAVFYNGNVGTISASGKTVDDIINFTKSYSEQ